MSSSVRSTRYRLLPMVDAAIMTFFLLFDFVNLPNGLEVGVSSSVSITLYHAARTCRAAPFTAVVSATETLSSANQAVAPSGGRYCCNRLVFAFNFHVLAPRRSFNVGFELAALSRW